MSAALTYLDQLTARRTLIEAEIRVAVAQARVDNITWQEIADAMGVSKQSAWERYGHSNDA